jgi:hypothetical protein
VTKFKCLTLQHVSTNVSLIPTVFSITACDFKTNVFSLTGVRGGAVGSGTRRSRVRFRMGPLELFINLILPALGLNQSLTDISTRDISWERGGGGSKGGRCVGLTTLPLSCADCINILAASTSWSPMGLYSDSFTFTFILINRT